MSRQLPVRPNLEYLKKQAKELLHDMRRQDLAYRLADAQHTIARDYGFPSWPKLKTHVESLAGPAARPASPAAAPPQRKKIDGVVNADGPLSDFPPSEPEIPNPFVGTWTANLSKSRLHPLNPFQSATLHFDVFGDTVTISDRVVDGSGREEQTENRLQADGREHPLEHGDGYRLLARWLGSNVLRAVVMKDGQMEGRVTYEVSSDGATLTISTDEQLIACDRSAPATPMKAV